VIREVKFPVWLANTVPVKQKNGKWRMCVDFTDLNKACKKDDFPLERVDKIVDDASNSEMLSLLDMFSGYHQIRVRKEDEEKTSFITPFGTFCFVRMPEGLKNAGCTFSRMIAIVLHPQIWRNILAYVDDIVVKSAQRKDHISDLLESSRMPSLNKGHRGQSRQNQGTGGNARSSFCEGCAEIDKKSGRAQQVHS
jgi:hypothetical protein